MLLFTIGAALLTGIGFGLAPALQGARANLSKDLKSSSQSTTNTRHSIGRRFGAGSGLVVAQVTLAMVVLTGAVLLVRTVDKLRSIDPGFDTHNVILFSLEPALAGYKGTQIGALYSDLQQRLSALPEVESVSYSSNALLDGGLWTEDVRVEGRMDKKVEPQMLAVGPNFLETMRIRLLEGRVLQQADMAPKRYAALVNREFVKQFVGARDPIGVRFGDADSKEPPWVIVGVVSDTKYAGLRDTDAPTAYVPLREGGATFSIRTRSETSGLMLALRNQINRVDSNLPLIRMRTQLETIGRLLITERLLARFFTAFALLGLLLACVGLYGLLSYEVSRRTRELGIRTALGANRGNVLMLVLGQGLAVVVLGAIVGIGVAMAFTRVLESLLYGVRPNDPLTFLFVTVLLMIVGFAACWLPARRATRVDPMEALRYE